MKDSRLTVLLTGIGGGGHGEQILKALRLGEIRYRIVGTDSSPLSANRTLVDEFHVIPPASSPEYLDTLTMLAAGAEARVILHGSEPEMMVLSRARPALEAAGFYVPVNSPATLEICQDKTRTLAHLAKAGFHGPKYREVRHVDDVDDFDIFPAIVKPSVGGGGSANIFIAQDRAELQMFCQYLLHLYPKFIVQEYVGRPDAEFTVGVLFGSDGVLINSIAIRRVIYNALSVRIRIPNRTQRSDLGASLIVSSGVSQGVIGRWPEVTSQCEMIAASLEPTAPVNIQCRLVNGIVVPFEINPRFSGTTSLRAMAGYNEPDVLIRRDVLGEKVPSHFPYREMTVMRRLEEIVVPPDSAAELHQRSVR